MSRDRGQGTGPQRLPQRVLVIGPSNLGDAILMSGVIATIHAQYPEAHVTLVVGARATTLFNEDPRIQTLVDADRFHSPLGRVQLGVALWRYQPHVVVDVRHTLYPFLLSPLTAWRYLRAPPTALLHMRARHQWKLHVQVPAIARHRVHPGPHESPFLWFTPKDTAHVEGLWKRWQLNGERPLVIISPGARSHIKRWLPEGFADVADRLIAKTKAQVVFSGEPAEESIVKAIVDLMDHSTHSAVGLVTIRQLGVLMRRADLAITNDSASLHLASALQVPTVAIFGPTDERKYGPTAPLQRTVRRRLFCAPCEQALCRFSHECMRFIDPDEVFHAAIQLLGQGTRDRGQGTRDKGQGTGDRGQGTGDKGQGTGDKGQGTGDKGQGTRDRGQGT